MAITTKYISKIKLPDETTSCDIIDGLSVHYLGTIGTGGTISTLPTPSELTEGDLYKAVSEVVTTSTVYNENDLICCHNNQWFLLASGSSNIEWGTF